MLPEWIPNLEDYLDLASDVLGASEDSLRKLPNLKLADSALHAPFASFGGVPAYGGVIEQAAALIARLSQNHPLPDGNKRAAFLMMARFLAANGFSWAVENVALDAGMVERIAASEATHEEIVSWIESRTSPS